MVTQDLRFSPPAPHAGMIVVQRAVGIGDYIDFLEAVARIYTSEEMQNLVLYYNW
jgi:hypothetical protein